MDKFFVALLLFLSGVIGLITCLQDIRIVSTDSNIIIPLPNGQLANGTIVGSNCFLKCFFTVEYPTDTSVNSIQYSQQYILDNLVFTKAKAD